MTHLSEGTLRRLYDEPDAVSDDERDHYNGCGRCQERFSAVAQDARAAATVMAVPSVTVDSAAALRRVRTAMAATSARRWALPAPRLPRLGAGRRWLPAAAGLVAILVASSALVGAGYMENILNIFEPRSTTTITVHPGDLTSSLLPDLSTYGEVRVTQQPELAQADSVAAAARATGLPAVTVGSLPAGVPTDATYATVSQGGASFTFSASKAQAAAAARGKTVPAMPRNLDGSTLSVKAGPAYGIVYGYSQLAGQMPPAESGPKPAESGPRSGASGSGISLPPLLGVAVARAPVISATNGVSARQLEDYLLAQPGISPELAAQIRAIGDPATTLPIPVPEGASSREVTIQGVKGTLIGDNTGLGAGAIWIKSGVVYAVVGTLTQQQVLDVANGLKIA